MGNLLAMITGNPVTLLYLAAGIAVAAAAAGGSAAWTVQGWRLDSAQKALIAVKGEYAIRDRAAEEAYSARYAAAVGRVRAAEDKSQADVAAVAGKLTKEVANVSKERDVALANVESGKLAFRVHLDTQRAGQASRDSTGTPSAGPGLCPPAASTGLLSSDDASFLVGLASEADAVVAQLDACQLIIVADRATAPVK